MIAMKRYPADTFGLYSLFFAEKMCYNTMHPTGGK